MRFLFTLQLAVQDVWAAHSRLCKAAFMFRFRNLCKQAGMPQLAEQAQTYRQAKLMANNYQQVCYMSFFKVAIHQLLKLPFVQK